MLIGSRKYINHADTGELKFSTGKRIFLNAKEWQEFKARIRQEQQKAIDQEKAGLR